jgi:hypothetical protein
MPSTQKIHWLQTLLDTPPTSVKVNGITFKVYDYSRRRSASVVLSTPGCATGIDEITTENDSPDDQPDESFISSDLSHLLQVAHEEQVLLLHISLQLPSNMNMREGQVSTIDFPSHPHLNSFSWELHRDLRSGNWWVESYLPADQY